MSNLVTSVQNNDVALNNKTLIAQKVVMEVIKMQPF